MQFPPEIKAILGGDPISITPLEKGATGDVWQICTQNQCFAFKHLTKRAPTAQLALDVHVRKLLITQGGAVSRPVSHGETWVLDEFVQGVHPERGSVPKAACIRLGETLKLLHKQPVQGFGQPKLSSSGQIVGQHTDPLTGISTRLSNPVPSADQLNQNPACRADTRFSTALPPYLAKLQAKLAENRASLCHSDLHERQFIIKNGALAALIDFGEATIADPRWDFGSLLYFHGPEVLAHTLLGYGASISVEDAYLFSLGIALHHANRSILGGKSHRLKVASVHLQKALLYLGKINGENYVT